MVVTMLCFVAVFLEVFSGAGILLLISMLIVACLLLYWIILIIWSLIMQRWQSTLWIVGVGFFEVCLFWSGVQNNNEIHFQIMRPVYLMEIAHDKSHPKTREWDWGGVLNFDDTLVYVNGVPIASSDDDNNRNGYKSTVERLSKHFFLIDTTW